MAFTLDENSQFYAEQVQAEALRLKVRRDARRIVEADELTAAFASPSEPDLIYAPLPPESPELIPGLLPQSGTAAIIGETETGKSLLACEIASALVTGTLLWGSIQPNKRLSKVTYILGEHTVRTIQGLFHRTQLPHEGNIKLIGPEHLHPHKALVISGVQQRLAVERLAKWCEGSGLIIFDPLAGFVQGEKSENDNVSMRTLIDSMTYIADVNGASCLILSHMGKPVLDGNTGAEHRRQTYAARGATAIEDSLTHIFYLKQGIALKQERTNNRYELTVRKFKGVNSSEAYKLMRDPETQRNTLVGAQTRNGRPSAEEREEMRDRVDRTLTNNPSFSWDTAVKTVADGAGMPVETLKRWLTSAA